DSFQQAVALDGRFYDAQGALAQLLLDRGKSDAALQYAQKLIQLQPNRAEGYFFEASALGNLQRYPQAEAAIQKYISLAPKDSRGLSHLGFIYAMEKRYADADKYFQQALQMNPQDTEALAGEGTVLAETKQNAKLVPFMQAELAKATASHAAPATLAVFNDQLARAYVGENKLNEAQAALQTAVGQDPHNYNTYVLLGDLFATRNAFSEAEQQFKLAAAANPKSAGLWTMVGMLDETLHKTAEAQQAYTKAVALDPSNGVADNNLASLLTTQPNELDQALQLAQRAKQVMPNMANVNDTLGWVYVNQGVYQLAIPLLQQAVRGNPKSTDFRVHLATALYRGGRKDEARTQLDAAIQLDKSLAQQPDVRQMLKN